MEPAARSPAPTGAPPKPRLSRQLLPTLKLAPQLTLPTYPVTGELYWLHIGVGAFHRAHQALCLQRLLIQEPTTPWRIIGTSLREADTTLLSTLNAQDNLTTLVEYGSTEQLQCHIIGAHQAIFSSYTEEMRLIKTFANPACQLVTFTVTEGGYYLLEAKGELLLTHADIENDLKASGTPRTIYGFLRKGLKARFQANKKPLTLLSCDNIIGNGHVLKMGLITFLELLQENKEFISWINAAVTFPNSMVDRITPAYKAEQTELLAERFGYIDKAPVHAELFWQWVIEDNFAAERPAFEKGGAELVSDVKSFEEMKLRILNAGHSCLAYRGLLLGYKTYDEVIADPKQRQFYDTYQKEEVLPQLSHLQHLDPQKYMEVATARFTNRQIADTLTRIGCDGMAKVPKFILPTLKANLKTQGPIRHAVEIIVNWAAVSRAFLAGEFPAYTDSEAKTLRAFMEKDGFAGGFLFNERLWGEDVVAHPRYIEQVKSSLKHGMTKKLT